MKQSCLNRKQIMPVRHELSVINNEAAHSNPIC
jgi:hypothetical protein